VIATETAVVFLLEHYAPGEAFEAIYLIGVLVVSAIWGLPLAIATSVVSAALIAYFGHWPSGHFAPFNLENGAIVVVFLIVALSTNFVASVARSRAVEAQRSAAMLQQSRDQLNVLAEQQQALRRVATLVARAVKPSEVFAAVAEELVRCMRVDTAQVLRYEPDGSALVVGSHSQRGVNLIPVGERLTLEGDNVAAMVLRTRRTARMDRYEGAAGSLAARIRELGLRSRVGAPILVNEHLWGVANLGSSRPDSLPPDSEQRISDFADLVATALANAATRAELIASRARIVASADDARRRLERDLHDGAQQRLVSLGMQARTVQESVPAELVDLKTELSDLVSGLTGVSTELQEISRGIHPAILSEGGLGPALNSLARRSTVPVSFDLAIEQRLPDSVEVAAYYVTAEALTNAAKHAQASEVSVRAETKAGTLHLSIRDNGIGGANSRKGSGLIGLKDRVETLGGEMTVTSPPGSGTSMSASIPLSPQ
jgi:signal transduction histidine kinase